MKFLLNIDMNIYLTQKLNRRLFNWKMYKKEFKLKHGDCKFDQMTFSIYVMREQIYLMRWKKRKVMNDFKF